MKKSQKTTSTEANKFPQISRFFPAGLIIFGLVFLIGLNMLASYLQPEYLKRLMQNPTSIEALESVMRQSENPELNRFLERFLEPSEVEKIRTEKRTQNIKIAKLESLLKKNPQYPDGFAYLAVLSYGFRKCDIAKQAITKAMELDPGREIFVKLNEIIEDCH